MIGSESMPAGTPVVRGPDFGAAATLTLPGLLGSFATMGFQATGLSDAIHEVNSMLNWRLSDEAWKPTDPDELRDPAVRAATRATIWLGITSNMISSGQREVIRYLAQHKLIDVIVTSAGGVEEDVMKTLRPHFVGDFALRGKHLRMRGLNRLGNLVVPNENYVAFEEWLTPLLDTMHDEADTSGVPWTPSTIIERFGREVGSPTRCGTGARATASPCFARASPTAPLATCSTSTTGSAQALWWTLQRTCGASTTLQCARGAAAW